MKSRIWICFLVFLLLVPNLTYSALSAGTLWEIRTTGNNNNGGGYNTGGTDYSQQDSAQLSLSDIVTDGTTTVTSVTGGFTVAMIGNIVNILTKGRFEIATFVDTNEITIDRTATVGSGLSAYVGGAVAGLEEIDDVIVAGNIAYIEIGTYTPSGAINVAAGSSLLSKVIEGYNSSRGDAPVGDNRPLIQCSTNAFYIGAYNSIKNCRVTISYTNGIDLGIYALALNCKSTKTTTGRAFKLGLGAAAVDCEAIGGAGITGIDISSNAGQVLFCFIHDTAIGIEGHSYGQVINTIIDGCTTYGIHMDASGMMIIGNTFYGNAVGIRAISYGAVIMNNIIEHKVGQTGANDSAEYKRNHWDYNNWHGGGTDVNNITKGPNSTAHDPKFTNAGSNDFSLQSDSQLLGAGFSIRLGVGE